MPTASFMGFALLALAPADAPVEPAIQLSWSAPAACPARDVVHEHAHARLEGTGAPVVAEATVTGSDAEGWTLTMTVRGPHGADERRIHAESCDALAEAAGLFIAVAAAPRPDADATLPEPPTGPSEPEPEPNPLPEPEPDPLPEPEPDPLPEALTAPTNDQAPPRTVEPEPEPSSRWRGLVRLEGATQFFRLLPDAVGGGLGGALGLWPGLARVRVEARAHYVFSQRVAYANDSAGGAFDLWVAGASACFEPQLASVSFPLCGGLEVGAMRGQGFGVTDPGSARALFLGLPLDAAVSWAPLPWLALWLGPRAVVSLRRPRFHVRDLGSLFRAGPAALRVVAGIELRFP